jgi:L-alanine-DL-glutamate epimerase-like enolase superfamily enzyme
MQLTVTTEDWRLARTFRIARGAQTVTTVVVVTVTDGEARGRGECEPQDHYGESVESVLGQIETIRGVLENGLSREELLHTLPAGAARNAVDCALWDLEAKRDNRSAWEIAGLSQPEFALPETRFTIDANESWSFDHLAAMAPKFAELGVVLIEQPLPADQDEALRNYFGPVPLCADESCHTRESLPKLRGLYDFINIKLDKTGGLTEALFLARAAQAAGFRLMTGCMTGTSLAMAPATLVASLSDFVDLDGGLMLREDRQPAMTCDLGRLQLPNPGLWG